MWPRLRATKLCKNIQVFLTFLRIAGFWHDDFLQKRRFYFRLSGVLTANGLRFDILASNTSFVKYKFLEAHRTGVFMRTTEKVDSEASAKSLKTMPDVWKPK